jgi:hypothetical protein
MMYDIGDKVRISVAFKDETGAGATPDSVDFTFQSPDPDEDEVTYHWAGSDTEIIYPGQILGEFYVDIFPNFAGVWQYRWVSPSTLNLPGAEPGQFEVRSAYLSKWRPSVAAVGAELRARTKDSVGTEVGTFNDDTRPTGDQVEELIDQAMGEVSVRVGMELPDQFLAMARQAVTLRTVMLIEMGNYPEHSVGADRTVYTSARLTYDEILKGLARNVQWDTLATRAWDPAA